MTHRMEHATEGVSSAPSGDLRESAAWHVEMDPGGAQELDASTAPPCVERQRSSG